MSLDTTGFAKTKILAETAGGLSNPRDSHFFLISFTAEIA